MQVYEQWSIDDVLDAHITLDIWDELERKNADEAERKQRAARATRK